MAFNSYEYNQQSYNANVANNVQSFLHIRYNLKAVVTSYLEASFDLGYSPLPVSFDVLKQVSSNTSFSFNYGTGFYPIYPHFDFIYDVEGLVLSNLPFSFNTNLESTYDIAFNVSSMNGLAVGGYSFVFNAYQQVLSESPILYSVVSDVLVNASYTLMYEVERRLAPSTNIITVEDNSDVSGYQDVYGIVDDVIWPPVSVCEKEIGTQIEIIECASSEKEQAVGAISFAVNLGVINNSCSAVYADRMLNAAASEVKNMAWNSEYIHQTNNSPSFVLKDSFGNTALTLLRKPADQTNIKDIEVFVTGVDLFGRVLPSGTRALYLKYDSIPFPRIEKYQGTTSEIAAEILKASELVTIDAPDTTLISSVSSSDSEILVNDTTLFANEGYVLIDAKEVIFYSGKTANSLKNCLRGLLNTTPTNFISGHAVEFCGPQWTAPLQIVRNIGFINDNNSKHMSLWKMLGFMMCLLWSQFYDRTNSFITRFAKLKYLNKLSSIINTSRWHKLIWEKVRALSVRSIETTNPTYIALDAEGYQKFVDKDIPQQGYVKIEDEEAYYTYYGSKFIINQCVAFCDDPEIEYIMRLDTRGANDTRAAVHAPNRRIEYIPSNLNTFSSDARFLSKSVVEPAHLFRERLRLYFGEKANFPSFRKILDVLEEIIPGSKIDIWDWYSTVDGKLRDENNNYVILDKEVGWLLAIPNRTEIGLSEHDQQFYPNAKMNTYLGLQVYTQGYWHWVEEGSQLLQVRGRYPFFIRTKKWWFDFDLLREVAERFKSAGTTPNYAFNIDVETFNTNISIEEESSELLSFDDNNFVNGDMSKGVVISTVSNTIDTTVLPENWRYVYPVAGVPISSVAYPELISHETYSQSDSTTETRCINSVAVKLINDSSSEDAYFAQLVSKPFGDKSYLAQFYIKSADPSNLVIDNTVILPYLNAGLSSSEAGTTIIKYQIFPLYDDWYVFTFVIDANQVDADLDYYVGLKIKPNKSVYVTNALMVENYSSTILTAIVGTGDKEVRIAPATTLPKAGVLKIDNELIHYATTTTYPGRFVARTLTRGFNSTTATAHSNGAVVELVMLYPYSSGQCHSMLYNTGSKKIKNSIEVTFNAN